ncbi:hypothetical protein GPUN_0347 [Glaciecola punicea ACAM 611]|uniref:DUF3703 domain-containing protein n=1 Tax=Glaciecola punicea ACAM 611 TaxID=1121923 RepID=H5T8L8_9ALTE|nr:DUF3703 domain-containing protein [Glaciecola punicea]OFA29948.1 hypothetical protein BAE46_13045 [Glaciecola punicea]GAB54494.1 hypothetical protein GPUN_0347 [Glaciecola punicea ACAM 611]
MIEDKLNPASQAQLRREYNKSFALLEDAHVIGQQSTYFHSLVHLKMLRHGLSMRNYKEVMWQLCRLIDAFTKTAIGLIPTGNTGGANVNRFRQMPISEKNKETIARIKHAQSRP